MSKKDKRANSVEQEKKNRGKAAAAVEKKKVERYDSFGRRIGTQGALINAKLDTKGKTNKQLAKECGYPLRRITTHTSHMHRNKFLVKGKDGKFALNPTNKAAKALLQERRKK